MLIDVIEAKYVRDFTIWVRFEDGSEGESICQKSCTDPFSSLCAM
jgi:hypothetical protein